MTGGKTEADPGDVADGGTCAAVEGVTPDAGVGVLEGATEVADGGATAESA